MSLTIRQHVQYIHEKLQLYNRKPVDLIDTLLELMKSKSASGEDVPAGGFGNSVRSKKASGEDGILTSVMTCLSVKGMSLRSSRQGCRGVIRTARGKGTVFGVNTGAGLGSIVLSAALISGQREDMGGNHFWKAYEPD